MQGMQLSGLACRVTSRQSPKEDCMTEMHLLCIYVRGFQLDNTGPKVNKRKLRIGQKMSAMNAYQTGCFGCRVVSRQSHCSFYLNRSLQKSLVFVSYSLFDWTSFV